MQKIIVANKASKINFCSVQLHTELKMISLNLIKLQNFYTFKSLSLTVCIRTYNSFKPTLEIV